MATDTVTIAAPSRKNPDGYCPNSGMAPSTVNTTCMGLLRRPVTKNAGKLHEESIRKPCRYHKMNMRAPSRKEVPYRQRVCKVLQYVVGILDDHCDNEAAKDLECNH